jgi:hypothetical protein
MDRHLAAQRLLNAWTDLLGANLPKPLAAASDALDAVEFSQAPHAGFDPASVTATNAEQKISELATVIAAERAFGEAVNRARNSIGQHVLNTAAEVLPDVLAVIEPRFRSAVQTFTESLDMLPDNPTSDALVAAGATAVQAFQTAKDAELTLDAIDRWALSLNELFGVQADPVLRLLAPSSREAFQTLLRAHDKKAGVLRSLWVTAATTPDVSWAINTPAQAKEIRRVLDGLKPTEYKKPQFVSFGR